MLIQKSLLVPKDEIIVYAEKIVRIKVQGLTLSIGNRKIQFKSSITLFGASSLYDYNQRSSFIWILFKHNETFGYINVYDDNFSSNFFYPVVQNPESYCVCDQFVIFNSANGCTPYDSRTGGCRPFSFTVERCFQVNDSFISFSNGKFFDDREQVLFKNLDLFKFDDVVVTDNTIILLNGDSLIVLNHSLQILHRMTVKGASRIVQGGYKIFIQQKDSLLMINEDYTSQEIFKGQVNHVQLEDHALIYARTVLDPFQCQRLADGMYFCRLDTKANPVVIDALKSNLNQLYLQEKSFMDRYQKKSEIYEQLQSLLLRNASSFAVFRNDITYEEKLQLSTLPPVQNRSNIFFVLKNSMKVCVNEKIVFLLELKYVVSGKKQLNPDSIQAVVGVDSIPIETRQECTVEGDIIKLAISFENTFSPFYHVYVCWFVNSVSRLSEYQYMGKMIPSQALVFNSELKFLLKGVLQWKSVRCQIENVPLGFELLKPNVWVSKDHNVVLYDSKLFFDAKDSAHVYELMNKHR